MGYSIGQKLHHGICASFEVRSWGEHARERVRAQHAGWEIVAPVPGASGDPRVELRGRAWRPRAGSFLVYNGAEEHTEAYSGERSGVQRMDAVVLFPAFLEGLFGELGVRAQELIFDEVLLPATGGMSVSMALLRELREEESGARLAFDCAASALAAEMALRIPSSASAKIRELSAQGRFPGNLQKAKGLICERMEDPSLSLHEIARAAGLSKFHFVREFRRATGLPPHRYLNELRVSLAAERIRRGEKVLTAALRSGFDSASTFHKAFLRRFGCPPGAFRRNGGASPESPSATGPLGAQARSRLASEIG